MLNVLAPSSALLHGLTIFDIVPPGSNVPFSLFSGRKKNNIIRRAGQGRKYNMSLEGKSIGHYHLLRLIGSGAMGEIYLAQDQHIDRQVAIKVIHSNFAEDQHEQMQRLFQREARAISMLDHPHILPLFDFGEAPLNHTYITYLVMPYHPEGSLDTWLQKRQQKDPLAPTIVEQIVRQAADALQYAHERNIVHQDVKESNFLARSNRVTPDVPHLLLADFGLAKLRSGTVTTNMQARGTPLYMAPEQWRSETVPASDQYALAIMAYRLLTNLYPFNTSGDVYTLMYHHIHTPPASICSLNPRLPSMLDQVLQRALAKDPGQRYPSIAAFAQAFQQATASRPFPATHVQSVAMSPHTFPGAAQQQPQVQAPVSPSLYSDATQAMPTSSMRNGPSSFVNQMPQSTMNPGPATWQQPPSTARNWPPSGSGSAAPGQMMPERGQNASSGQNRSPSYKYVVPIACLVLVLLFGIIGVVLLNNAGARNGPTGQVQSTIVSTMPANQTPDTTQGKGNTTPTATPASSDDAKATAAAEATASAVAVPTPGATSPGKTAALQVQSVTITPSPETASGRCGTDTSAKVTYTLTMTVNANSPGGTVQFRYSTNNGQTYTGVSLTFAAGETSKTYSFEDTVPLPTQAGDPQPVPEHTAIVITSTPNSVTGKTVPSAACTTS